MKIVGCDLHARQQTIAMVDTETGEFTEKTLRSKFVFDVYDRYTMNPAEPAQAFVPSFICYKT
jgi:hypothetical protein